VILQRLTGQTRRFNELRRTIPRITQRMLTTQLRELEKDKLVSRKVYAEVPPRVEYSLTSKGESLEPVIHALLHWGEKNL
jgi:DNA-binding HxlR family transcriptional regulator